MPFGAALVAIFGAHKTGTGPLPPTPPGSVTNVVLGDSLATIQGKLNSVTAGNSLVFPSGTFNLGGNLIGKNGITVWSYGGTTITNGDFDFSNKSNWTIRGASATQTSTNGFTFSGTSRIACGGASGIWTIGNCSFLNTTLRPASGPSAGSDGSAIYYPNANPNLSTDQGLIINCNFTGCNGVVVGSALTANCNNITHDGLHFLNCRQPSSLQFSLPSNPAFGNHIWWYRSAFEGTTRACLEFGPNSNGPEYMNDLRCIDCWFGNFNHTPANNDGTLLAISFVAINAINTTVTGNFIMRGPINSGIVWPGIEFAGSGTCSGNTVVDANWAGFTYASGWNVHNNDAWFDAGNPNFGGTTNGSWANNGSGSGTFGPGNVAHSGTFPGPIPPYPTRITF